MKKIISLIAALLVCAMCAACEEVTFPDIDTMFKEQEAGTSGDKIVLDFKSDSIGDPSEKTPTDIPEGKPRIIGITLDQKVITVGLGKTERITYSVKPDTAYDKSVYYESSNDAIVQVDKDGYVLGVAPGAVTVNVRTNDGGFKRTVTVIVVRNEGNAEQSQAVTDLINEARIANGYTATSDANSSLLAAANQRALEEAIDMVNYGEAKMDDTRTMLVDGKPEENPVTIFTEYNIWSKSSKSVFVWGVYDAEQAYRAFVEDDECAEALGVRGSGAESYDYIAVGCYEFDGITYWSILMTSS